MNLLADRSSAIRVAGRRAAGLCAAASGLAVVLCKDHFGPRRPRGVNHGSQPRRARQYQDSQAQRARARRLPRPLTPNHERRDAKGNRIWIDDAWLSILAADQDPDAPLPHWRTGRGQQDHRQLVPLWRPFARRSSGRSWAEQIKPFNFLMVPTIDPFRRRPHQVPAHRPYNDNPEIWASLGWRNIYDPDGPNYRITTDREAPPDPTLAVVKSYADVLHEYLIHPEHKFSGPDGQPCRRNTRGLLQRRRVDLTSPPLLIGKEANNIDEAQARRYAQLDEIINEYHNPTDDHFHQQVMPALDHLTGRNSQVLSWLTGAPSTESEPGRCRDVRYARPWSGSPVNLAETATCGTGDIAADANEVASAKRACQPAAPEAPWVVSRSAGNQLIKSRSAMHLGL